MKLKHWNWDFSGIVDLWERRHIFSYHNCYNNNNNNDNNNNNNKKKKKKKKKKTLMAVTITGISRTSSLHYWPSVMISGSVSSSSIFLVDIVISIIIIISSNSSSAVLNYLYFLYREIARHTIGCRRFIYVCFKPIFHWYLCEASITPALSWFKMLWVLYVIRITKLTHNFVVHRRTNVYRHASTFHNTSVMTRRVYSNSKI